MPSITRVQPTFVVLGAGKNGEQCEGGRGAGRGMGVRQRLILVSSGRGRPLSAQLVLSVVLVQQFDVREGKVATFAFTFALPLAVHVDFGHLHQVAHLWWEAERKGGRGVERMSDTRRL